LIKYLAIFVIIAIILHTTVTIETTANSMDIKTPSEGYIVIDINNNSLTITLFKTFNESLNYIKRIITISARLESLNYTCLRNVNLETKSKGKNISIMLRYEIKPQKPRHIIAGFLVLNIQSMNLTTYFTGTLNDNEVMFNSTCYIPLNKTSLTNIVQKRKIILDMINASSLNEELRNRGLNFINVQRSIASLEGNSLALDVSGVVCLSDIPLTKNIIVKIMAHYGFDVNTTMLYLLTEKYSDIDLVHTAIYTLYNEQDKLSLTSISSLDIRKASAIIIQALLHIVLRNELLLYIPAEFPILATNTIGLIHYLDPQTLTPIGVMATPITLLIPENLDIRNIPRIIKGIVKEASTKFQLPVVLRLNMENMKLKILEKVDREGVIGFNETMLVLRPDAVDKLDNVTITLYTYVGETSVIEQYLLAALVISATALALSLYIVFLRIKRKRGK